MNSQKIAVNISGKEADKLFNFRPVFFTAIFLCFGIMFAYACRFYQLSAWWSVCLLPIFITAIFLQKGGKNRKLALLATSVLAAVFAIGGLVFNSALDTFANCKEYNGEYTVTGTVVEKSEHGHIYRVILQDVYIGENYEKGKLIAYLPTSFCENVAVSDEVLFRGYVETNVEYFNQYGFREYEIGNKIQFLVQNGENCFITGKSSNLFLRIRARVETVLFSSMDETSASVTLAVLTGDTSFIEDGLLQNIRLGGIAHIFAVSGLHMGALYAFCLWLTEKTRLNRIPKPIRFVFMFALLYFYAGVCGFSSSVMRAMALCLVGYAAKLIGTERDFLQSTGVAAMLILFVKPTELFAVGFQLSFAACVGIALFARPLRLAMEWCAIVIKQKIIEIFRWNERARPNPEEKKEEFLTLRNKIQTAVITFVSVSLAAQIATAPLQLYVFGYLSVWGLLLNGIFVPFISVVFSILLLFVLLSCICMPIAPILLYLPSVVWNGVLLLFEAIDFSKFVISGIKITIGSMLCYYGGWIFLTDKGNMPKAFKWGLALLCFITFGITMYALNV